VEKEFINGATVKYMMVSGTKVSSTVMEFGKASLEIVTLVNGSVLELMGTEFILGVTVIGTKVNGKHVSSMAMAQTFSETETFILDTTRTANQMATANIFGQVKVVMLVTSKTDLSMVKANGNKRKEQSVILMKVNITMILSKVKESLDGPVVIYTLDIIKTMSVMVMVK
jgi:hypothetical protein